MKNIIYVGALALAVGMAGCTSTNESATLPAPATMPEPPAPVPPVMVGGAEMLPTRTIVENAANSQDHTTLVTAVKAAGLAETLSGPGPYTVFAPTNAAFDKLPPGTLNTLLKPANKALLTKVLTYHVVAGKMSAADIAAAIQAGGGKASLTTVEGGALTATTAGDTITLTDEKGGMSHVTIGDVNQSNGVIHVVDTVLMPS